MDEVSLAEGVEGACTAGSLIPRPPPAEPHGRRSEPRRSSGHGGRRISSTREVCPSVLRAVAFLCLLFAFSCASAEAASVYRVRPGDTLSAIALHYRTT